MKEKKTLLLQVLEKLKWTWNLANSMIILVECEYCSEDLLDALIRFINKNVKKIKDMEKNMDITNTLMEIEKLTNSK